MLAFLFTIGLFIYWGVLGLAILTVFPSRLRILQNMLIAPTLGLAITLIPVFMINRFGIPIKHFALLYAMVLMLLAMVILLVKRPIVPMPKLLPYMGILLVALLIVANPMFSYGFDWVSYSN